MTLRNTIERRSRMPLLTLSRLPRVAVPLLTVALFMGTLLLPAVPAAFCFVVIWLFLAWLAFLAWPGLPTSGRVARLVALVVLTAIGVNAVLN